MDQLQCLRLKSNSYSLVVSGAGLWNGDKDEMVKILQANKLFAKNSVYTFTYDTDTGGTRKMSYQNAIDTAYSECTIMILHFSFIVDMVWKALQRVWGFF